MTAEKRGLDLDRWQMRVAAEWTPAPGSRIASVTFTVTPPRKLSEEDEAALRQAVGLCPIHNSLHPEVKVSVLFASA